jgi:hypothetical protein
MNDMTSVEAGRSEAREPRFTPLEVDRHEPQGRRSREPELGEALLLPRLRLGLVDLEHVQARRDLRPSLGERVKPRSQDDVLDDAARELLFHMVLDETGTSHDRRAKGPRERAHVGSLLPVYVGCDECEAELVVEHVRWCVGEHVERTPERDADSGVVGHGPRKVSHDATPSGLRWAAVPER